MKLKYLYILSVVGIFLAGFGAGWIVISQILSLPVTHLTAVGVSFAMVGLGIMISTLSTIRKIDVMIEDV